MASDLARLARGDPLNERSIRLLDALSADMESIQKALALSSGFGYNKYKRSSTAHRRHMYLCLKPGDAEESGSAHCLRKVSYSHVTLRVKSCHLGSIASVTTPMIPIMAINKLKSGKKLWQVDWTTLEGTRTRKRFATKREAEDFERNTIQALRSGDLR